MVKMVGVTSSECFLVYDVTSTQTLVVVGSSSSSRNEYYLGGVMALLLQDHRTCDTMSIKTVKKNSL